MNAYETRHAEIGPKNKENCIELLDMEEARMVRVYHRIERVAYRTSQDTIQLEKSQDVSTHTGQAKKGNDQ